MAQKPSIPKGTRDFSPTEVAKRTYIFNTIQRSFELYGFQPIETPSFENSSTLMGKYGEEGDRLIFKILNSGDFLKKFIDFFHNVSVTVFIDFFKNVKSNNLSFDTFWDNEQTSLDILVETYFDGNSRQGELNGVKIFNKSYYRLLSLVISLRKEEIIKLYSKDDDTLEEEQFLFFSELASVLFSRWLSENSNIFGTTISEKALRYDLTVPFARYVVQHRNDIELPFKRYQMQPVWRADKPQRGRYREFYQCDADVVGSKSLVQEVEFVQLYDAIFTDLGIATTIKLNNRKILSGIAEIIGASDKLIDFTVALDKLDKIGEEGVIKEMLSKEISEEAIEKVKPLFSLSGTNQEKLAQLKVMLSDSDEGTQGVADLQYVLENVEQLGLKSANLALDVTLARGLNYYTGAIFEVAANDVELGSIGGGGRYDDLTGIFGWPDLSGIGISFGLDRIYLVLEELDLFEKVELPKPKVLFLNFDANKQVAYLKAIKTLRDNNVKCELYPDTANSNKKEKKQWKYAFNREIEFIVSAIENEIYTVKNTNTSEQESYKLEELLKAVQNS